jgi:hypothetical protein
MLGLKEFLEQECANVRQLLNDTLRNAYSVEDGRRFYLECSSRVSALEKQIADVEAKALKTQGLLSDRLSNLSRLISGIERSHIGEISWAFAEFLNLLAVDICKHEEALPPAFDPLFFYSAEGGLYAYSVDFDPLREEITDAKNRIFHVVFPRSLKHSVLLHPILGHEIGHAAYSQPNMSVRLDAEMLDRLLSNGDLTSPKDLKNWLSSAYKTTVPMDEAKEIFSDWKEEYLCDLFGLVLMGPSFVMAHRSLLRTIDPPGDELSSTHPPKLTRYWMIDVATRHLKWDKFAAKATGTFAEAVKTCRARCQEPLNGLQDHFKVFEEQSIRDAVDGLKKILEPIPKAVYQLPLYAEIEAMVDHICDATPPIRTGIKFDNKNPLDYKLEIPSNDFRSILYAGWVAWHRCKGSEQQVRFSTINRLCDMGLLHLQGAAKWQANKRAMEGRYGSAEQKENSPGA